MKKPHFLQIFYRVLCLALVVLATACTSPEEKALEYLGKGETLLAAGEPVKAKLEFQNALDLDDKMAPAWYGLALVAEQEGELQQAFILLSRVTEIDPGHLAALVKKGRLLVAAGQLDKALEISNTTLELAPEDASVLSLRAALFYKLEDTEGALAMANRALAVDPTEVNALVVLASERLAVGDAEKAIAYLDQGIDSDEKNIALQLIKIHALSSLDKLDLAEQVFLGLIELYPQIDIFRQELAGFYVAQFREADAEQVYRDIVVANPGDMDARMDLVRFVNASKGYDAAIAEVRQFIQAEPDNMQWLFAQAELEQAAQQPEAARKTLQSIVTRAESDEDAHKAKGQLAMYHMQGGEREQAAALMNEILAEDPRNEQAIIFTSSRLIEERNLDQAISNLRTILRDNPESAQALLLLGKAHELAGARDLADDNYARAFEASGHSPEFGLPYARFLLRSQRVERASAVLEEGLSGRPNHIPSLTLLARVRLDTGDWAGAQAIADHLQQLDEAPGVSQQIMGAVYAGQQNSEQSIAAFKQAYQASSSAVQPMVSLVRAYARAGKQDEAHNFLDSVLAANPDNSSARVLKGQLYLSQQQYGSAAELFKAVIERDPTYLVAYRHLAELEGRTGKAAAVIEVLDQGLAANPGDFNLSMAKAGVLEQQQEFEAVIAIYEEMLTTRPNSDLLANNLASMLSEHRDDEASLRRANELAMRFRNSDNFNFKDTLGWTYFRLGDIQEARALIEQAAQERPEMPLFRYHLGMIYLSMDEKDAARRELEKALELAGEDASPLREEVLEAINSL